MSRIQRFFDKLFENTLGSVYGLISMLIGAVFTLISIAFYPGYSMLTFYISYFGIGPGLSAPIFNLGLILAGLMAIPFFVYLGRILKIEGVNEKYRRNTTIIAIIACISLSLVGCFPAYNLVLLIIHGTFAALFFLCSLIFCLAFSYLMWNDKRFPKAQSGFGLIVGGIFFSYCITLQPIIEWICFFALVTWIIETSIFTLYHFAPKK